MNWLLAVLISVTACADVLDASDGDVDPPAPDSSMGPELRRAHQSPRAIVEYADDAVEFAAQVLEAASVASAAGGPRVFGTVSETDMGVTYEPIPTDRLIAQRANGRRFELSILELDGGGNDAASFLRGDHRLRVRFLSGPEFEGEVSTLRQGPTRQVGINGRVTIEDARWVVELQRNGTESFDVDQTGSRLFDDHELTGRAETPGMKIDVSEHWTFEIVTARDDGSGASANSIVRRVNDAALLGDQRFVWDDVRMQRAFRDGKPTELDTYWRGSGQITRNGVPVGRVEKFANAIGESGGFVGFQVVTADGTLELERYQAY